MLSKAMFLGIMGLLMAAEAYPEVLAPSTRRRSVWAARCVRILGAVFLGVSLSWM